LVRYSEDSKAYRVFLPDQHKEVVRRNVKFEENLASRKSQDLPVIAKGPQEVGPKDEPRVETSGAGSQTPVEVEEQAAPSTSVWRPRWFETLSRPCGMLESMLSLPGAHSRRADPHGNFSSIWL
jgi:hypothetical protein